MANPQNAEILLPRATLAGSLLFVSALAGCYWFFQSQLALAQAADSFMDVFTASVLMWTVHISRQPQDKEHPFGHTRAQPIGALVTAVIAGVIAVEVGRSALFALIEGAHPRLDYIMLAAFGGKVLFKGTVFVLSRNYGKSRPALRALAVDARNDVLVGLLAVTGFFGATLGFEMLDAWLALPIALWIGWSGVELARDNIRLLMGEAPDDERQSQLEELARQVPGVVAAHDLRAHFLGTQLHVHVHIVVDPNLSLKQAHDIGEAVRQKIEDQPDVAHCSTHIDIE
ncbi:MAG: cation transporter [Planctomycetes bacterium]|nr:cation transporter [Planctomycetota bacterium]MCW8135718.1 cation transporter [Planctomycetota bacterium]